MISSINSPEHAVHAAGFVEALAMRNTAYKPDPAPIMRRTMPYCDCENRLCPVCYPPIQSEAAPGFPRARDFNETPASEWAKLERKV